MEAARVFAQELAVLIRQHLGSLDRWKLMDVRVGKNSPELVLTVLQDGHETVMLSFTITAGMYSVMPALTRGDVRTPGPSKHETRVFWRLPHYSEFRRGSEGCTGLEGSDGRCQEKGCYYTGDIEKSPE